jgi:hypothetical protein
MNGYKYIILNTSKWYTNVFLKFPVYSFQRFICSFFLYNIILLKYILQLPFYYKNKEKNIIYYILKQKKKKKKDYSII